MSEFTASELGKILKEHERWIDTYCTDKIEGEIADLRGANLSDANLIDANLSRANLSGADLTQVKNLSINKLSKVETLYKAKLDPELKKQVKDKYPHLLKKPKP